jgi:DNA-binding transcriptional LysR family regulator
MDELHAKEVTFADLEMFLSFAKNEHFGRTAAELGVSVATVQRSVRALERKLGVNLVEQAGRRVRMLHTGHVLVREAHTVLRARLDAVNTTRADSGHPQRLLRIAHTYSVGLRFVPAVLAELLGTHPELRFRCLQSSATEQGRDGRTALRPPRRGGVHLLDEHPRRQARFLAVLAPAPTLEPLVEGLGTLWHLSSNGYKAYPSGSLTHPTIDAVLALRDRHGSLTASDVASVEARVHPYAATVTGKVRPRTGLDAKFSLTHGVAVALVAGRPGLAHFTDTAAVDPVLAEVRELVRVVADDTLSKRGAAVTISLHGGATLRETVADNRGTLENPLLDSDLEAKFMDVASPRMGAVAAARLLDRCWRAEELADFGELVRSTAGGRT